jgi:hypothetical protein
MFDKMPNLPLLKAIVKRSVPRNVQPTIPETHPAVAAVSVVDSSLHWKTFPPQLFEMTLELY